MKHLGMHESLAKLFPQRTPQPTPRHPKPYFLHASLVYILRITAHVNVPVLLMFYASLCMWHVTLPESELLYFQPFEALSHCSCSCGHWLHFCCTCMYVGLYNVNSKRTIPDKQNLLSMTLSKQPSLDLDANIQVHPQPHSSLCE